MLLGITYVKLGITYHYPYPNPNVGSLTYVNVGKKTIKRLRKRPYNVGNNQRRESSFQRHDIALLYVRFNNTLQVMVPMRTNNKYQA